MPLKKALKSTFWKGTPCPRENWSKMQEPRYSLVMLLDFKIKFKSFGQPDQKIIILYTRIPYQNTILNNKRYAKKERASQGFYIQPYCTSSIRATDSFKHIRNQGICSLIQRKYQRTNSSQPRETLAKRLMVSIRDICTVLLRWKHWDKGHIIQCKYFVLIILRLYNQ